MHIACTMYFALKINYYHLKSDIKHEARAKFVNACLPLQFCPHCPGLESSRSTHPSGTNISRVRRQERTFHTVQTAVIIVLSSVQEFYNSTDTLLQPDNI